MAKGILLEMGGREAVVLTPQGEFKKVLVPKGTWDIGDEIDFAETPQQSYWAKWGLAAAAAAIMLLAPLGFQQVQLRMPAAIVTMDINPSVELTLNKYDDVLTAQGLNADGAALLQHISTKGRPPLDQVVQAVTQAAADMNKLDPADPSSAVLVAVAPTGDKELPAAKAETLRDKAKQAVAAQVSQVAKAKGAEPQTNVAGVVVTPEEKKAAEAAGLSPGKYVFYEEVKQVVPDVKVEDVQNAGPGKLLKNLNINVGDFFSKAEEKHGTDNQGKAKSDQKSEDKSQQQVVPASSKPEDKQPGNDKSENPGKGNDKQDQKPEQKQDDKGNTPVEPKKDDKQPDQKHENGNGNGVKNQENKGSAGAKDDKQSNSGNKGDSKKQESPGQKENGNEKKSSWTIPFLGITIEKPSFLQGKDNASTEPPAEVVTTPRADEPGAGAPSDKQSGQQQPDQKQPDQKQPDQKQPGQKQPDQKQPDQKQPDQKQPDQKQPEQKQSEQKQPDQKDQKQSDEKQSDKGSSKEQGKGTGYDQGSKGSGKSNPKDNRD